MKTRPYQLTKSKMLSFRQCAKRLHLEIHRPDLIEIDPAMQRIFDQGNEVGTKARELYGPGTVLDIKQGATAVVAQTQKLIESGYKQPIYEAAFLHDGVLVLADVVIATAKGLRVIEVKSSTQVKDINLFDSAVQKWVMAGAGHKIASVAIAHINNQFVYQGDGDYQGLLKEVPVDKKIAKDLALVPSMVAAAKKTIAEAEPKQDMGKHCTDPYDCTFQEYCEGPQSDYPIKTLPRIGVKRWALEKEGFKDIRDIPDGRLTNADQIRVWNAAHTGKAELKPDATKEISKLPYPRYYLDFETIAFAVPIWKDTRPYEQLPFQWACKIEHKDGKTESVDFLDLSGQAPMRACAEKLLATLKTKGAIVTYSAFESGVIERLAKRYPDLVKDLRALLPRLADLLPITRQNYYHPRMAGSWSIKKVLPTFAPDLDYAKLEEVQDGGGAQIAYLEAISTKDAARKKQLEERLLTYCGLDAEAMVRTTHFISSGSS